MIKFNGQYFSSLADIKRYIAKYKLNPLGFKLYSYENKQINIHRMNMISIKI